MDAFYCFLVGVFSRGDAPCLGGLAIGAGRALMGLDVL